jgi:hypothetical protein
VRASTDMMEGERGGVKKGPTPTEAEATFETADGEGLGVDHRGSSTRGPIEAGGGGDLSSHDLSGCGPAHSTGAAGLGSDSRSPSPRPLARALRGADPAGGRARGVVDPLVREREPAARGMAAELPRAGDGLLGGMLRPAAFLALQVGALTLISEPADAPWPNQFGAMLFWLAGCVLLSLFLSRR